MITINQTGGVAGDDNNVIWFFRSYIDGQYIYLTDYDIGITLNNTYDGNSLESISNMIDISYNLSSGSDLGTIPSIVLSITRDSNNIRFEDFFNEFYPNTDAQLVNTIWDVGIGWESNSSGYINADSDITWLYEMRVQSYNYTYTNLNIVLYGFDIYNVQLPKHLVQNSNKNANFVFSNAPEESLNMPLPLLYGDCARTLDGSTQYRPAIYFLAPTICTDFTTKEYYCASHKLKIHGLIDGGVTYIFKRLETADTYMWLYPKNTSSFSSINNNSCSKFIYFDNTEQHQTLYGRVFIRSFNDKRINKFYSSTQITSIINSSGLIKINVRDDFLVKNDKIYINGVLGMTDLNGYWSIYDVIDNYVYIELTTSQSYISGGSITYLGIELPIGDSLVQLDLDTEISDNDLGVFSSLVNDVKWTVGASTVSGSQILSVATTSPQTSASTSDDYTINTYGGNLVDSVQSIGNAKAWKIGNYLPCNMTELKNAALFLENLADANTQSIYIYGVTLTISNILVSSLPQIKRQGLSIVNTRNNDGGRKSTSYRRT